MSKYLLAIILLICLAILNSHFCVFSFHTSKSSEDEVIRVMSYNTNGINGDYKNDDFVESFLTVIDSIHPQLLALQEMRVEYSDVLCNELQKRYPYNSIDELSKRRLYSIGVASLFSLYPIVDFSRINYNRQEVDSIYDCYLVPDSLRQYFNSDIYRAILDIDGHETLVICCYLKTNDYSMLRSKYSNRWLDGLDDYLEGYKIGRAFRLMSAQMIRDCIAKYDLPTIVCGDMNDFQFSRPVKTIMGEDLKNIWWERGMGYGMTYDKYHLKLRIDHMLISKEFEPISVEVPHLRFSDHYPIVAEVRMIN